MQPFSRDHYVGLVVAKHLLDAANESVEIRRQAVREFIDAWHREIRSHFDEEERLLIPLVDRPGEVSRLYREHRNLRRFAEQAQRRLDATDVPAEWVRELGEQLRDHIRWEERELFGMVEHAATDEQLDDLATQTNVIEQHRDRSSRSNHNVSFTDGTQP